MLRISFTKTPSLTIPTLVAIILLPGHVQWYSLSLHRPHASDQKHDVAAITPMHLVFPISPHSKASQESKCCGDKCWSGNIPRLPVPHRQKIGSGQQPRNLMATITLGKKTAGAPKKSSGQNKRTDCHAQRAAKGDTMRVRHGW